MQKCFQQICLKLVLRKSFRRKHKKMLTRFQVNIPGNKTTTSPNTLKNEARVPGQSAPIYKMSNLPLNCDNFTLENTFLCQFYVVKRPPELYKFAT